MTTDSSRYEEVVQFWCALAVFEAIRDNVQRQNLCLRQRFVSGGAVGEHTREIDDLCEPAAVVLLVQLLRKLIAAQCRSTSPDYPGSTNFRHTLPTLEDCPSNRRLRSFAPIPARPSNARPPRPAPIARRFPFQEQAIGALVNLLECA